MRGDHRRDRAPAAAVDRHGRRRQWQTRRPGYRRLLVVPALLLLGLQGTSGAGGASEASAAQVQVQAQAQAQAQPVMVVVAVAPEEKRRQGSGGVRRQQEQGQEQEENAAAAASQVVAGQEGPRGRLVGNQLLSKDHDPERTLLLLSPNERICLQARA